MKKYFWSIIFSLFVGLYLGRFMLNQYDGYDIISTSIGAEKMYFIEYGVYDSLESMKDEMSFFKYYIYDNEGDGYHSYLGITKSYENALKIKEYFNSLGYDIYVREISISNSLFVSVIEQYDLLLNDASGSAIEDICNQVLNSYEELVINGDEDEGDSK